MITSDMLLTRIQKIDRSEYDDLVNRQLDHWIQRIQETEIQKAIVENRFIRDRLEEYQKEIKEIEEILLEKRSLPELERLNLLDKKDLYKKFIQSFDPHIVLEAIAEELAHYD